VPQLETLNIEPGADLIALIKPAYELNLPEPPTDDFLLGAAVSDAARALSESGWSVMATERSPVLGHRGAIEYIVHGRKPGILAQSRSTQTAPRLVR
jgi:predicted rRNA methylase YqxC with S4 and FtsJ domains